MILALILLIQKLTGKSRLLAGSFLTNWTRIHSCKLVWWYSSQGQSLWLCVATSLNWKWKLTVHYIAKWWSLIQFYVFPAVFVLLLYPVNLIYADASTSMLSTHMPLVCFHISFSYGLPCIFNVFTVCSGRVEAKFTYQPFHSIV